MLCWYGFVRLVHLFYTVNLTQPDYMYIAIQVIGIGRFIFMILQGYSLIEMIINLSIVLILYLFLTYISIRQWL